jgi:predicted nucleic acid-binding protein
VTATTCIVVADACVLINLMHVSRLDLCARIPGFEIVVPEQVREEVVRQRATLDDAISRGVLRIEAITDLGAFVLFARLTERLGRGEAACLTLAVERGWLVASDEKGRFRREAEERLGKERLLGTADLFMKAIHAGQLSVEEADADKAVLETHRFKMEVATFRELIK